MEARREERYLESTETFFLWGLNLRHNVIIHPKHSNWNSSTPFIPKRTHSALHRNEPGSLGIWCHHAGLWFNYPSLNRRRIGAQRSERRRWRINGETLQTRNEASWKGEHGRAVGTETEMDPRETNWIEKMEMRRIALRLPREMKMATMVEREIAEPSSLAGFDWYATVHAKTLILGKGDTREGASGFRVLSDE